MENKRSPTQPEQSLPVILCYNGCKAEYLLLVSCRSGRSAASFPGDGADRFDPLNDGFPHGYVPLLLTGIQSLYEYTRTVVR